MARKKIRRILKDCVKTLCRKPPSGIQVEYSSRREHGDYSTNLALELAKRIKRDPLKVAQDIVLCISRRELDIFENIEIKKPGFINFFLTKKYLRGQVRKILREGTDFGKTNIGRGKKVNVEFISANPTGPLHIGNGRGAIFGDTLCNLLEKSGFKVTREYYVNDAKISNQIQTLGTTALGKGKDYLSPYLKSLIQELKPHLKVIKSESDAGYFLSQNVQRDNRYFIERKLKIKFDLWVSEQNLYRNNKVDNIFRILQKKKLVYKENGACWLKSSNFGANKDNVLIRKNGQPTYFLSDIAYHHDKIKRGYKKIIDIWGADHQGHVKRMNAAMKMLGYRGNFKILISQMVKLKSGKKLSKRKGEVILLKDLIDEVGIDVARYFYLSKSLSSQVEFDLELAKEQSEKNPVFYAQYAYVRIKSILRKAKLHSFKIKNYVPSELDHPSEMTLIKELIRFPEIIEETEKDCQLQRLPEYTKKVASAFHRFYRDCKVLNQDKKISKARFSLLLSTEIIFRNLFFLLGISIPKKM